MRFTLRSLLERYQDCSFGSIEPDEIVMGPDIYCACKDKISESYRAKGEIPSFVPGEGGNGFRFLGATVTCDQSIPGGTVVLRNTEHPNDLRFNRFLVYEVSE